ncbi:alpha/beta fold hydrolase [Mycobacterium sp. 94-17]|uniref:alpha/beta fold hydrolase n=1 Tax=Mycobacterium sp. 94-17 TaxID=2986147 RepID=UPI002D1EC911|nr:alpha/beta fold hydrolase [Mycobacterium sp. 94-17]MEB4212014.1 alpha/beta fold hydrolase [Mycobacterium sp. 94-17]
MSMSVPTKLGRLNVTDAGHGPVTVFWHSLFVDQSSWRPVFDALAGTRRIIAVDAPNHGRSRPVEHDFTIDDCAAAACAILDHLDIPGPVDWVGNALGGHVGITLAAAKPERVKSLVTIGTPIEPFGAVEKWTQIVPLVQLYRAFGPNAVDRILTKALLGADPVASQPDQARLIMDAFRNADHHAMLRAMRCLMLRRRSLRDDIVRVTAPTLLLVAEGGQEGWTPSKSADAARTMTNARSETLPGTGNIAPLLVAPAVVAERLERFWAG